MRAWESESNPAGVRETGLETVEPTLAGLPADRGFDHAFVHAHEPGYRDDLALLVGLVRPAGLILFDNVLWNGALLDESKPDENTVGIRVFDHPIAKDQRFDRVMAAIGDGITMPQVP